MLGELIELVLAIWKADSTMRENSLVGESEMDRKSRRCVAILCGGMIALLAVVSFVLVLLLW